MNLFLGLFLIMTLLFIFVPLSYSEETPDKAIPELFLYDNETQSMQSLDSLPDIVKRISFAKINTDALNYDTLSIDLFGEYVEVTKREIEPNNRVDLSWIGTIKDHGGTVILHVNDGVLLGKIDTVNSDFMVRSYQNNIYVIQEMDSSKFPPKDSMHIEQIDTNTHSNFNTISNLRQFESWIVYVIVVVLTIGIASYVVNHKRNKKNSVI